MGTTPLDLKNTGRFFSGLSADSFRKRISLVEFDQSALDRLSQSIIDFALTEGFDAHAKSIAKRAEHQPNASNESQPLTPKR